MSGNSQNHIKLGSSTISSISVGDFSVGVAGGSDYGPSTNTGFYNGIVPSGGGYIIYINNPGQVLTAHAPKDDAECLYYLNRYGASAANISDALTWASSQSNLLVRSSEYVIGDLPGAGASIVTSGLVLNLDAGNFSSYPTSGNTWYDISGNGYDATMIDVVYSSNYGGILTMVDRTKQISIPNSGQFNFYYQPFSFSMWINPSTWTSAATVETLLDFEDGGWGGWLLRNLESNGRLGGNRDQQLSTTLPSIGTWTQITFTSDGYNGKMYFNNTLNYTQNGLVYGGNSGTPYGLFCNYDVNATYGRSNGQGFIGSFGSVQIYNKELSSPEVTQNYDATKTRFGL
jgi:hypothetical protein